MNVHDAMRLQVAHNRWINRHLHEICDQLSDDERKRDLGAFFGSIHGTFNHLLLVDRLWMGRLTDQPFHVNSLAQELYTDWEELKRERARAAADLKRFVHSLDEKALDRPVSYRNTRGRQRAFSVGTILTHLFHHQTHHRGQITVLIGQLGHDFGETDLIGMPGVACRVGNDD